MLATYCLLREAKAASVVRTLVETGKLQVRQGLFPLLAPAVTSGVLAAILWQYGKLMPCIISIYLRLLADESATTLTKWGCDRRRDIRALGYTVDAQLRSPFASVFGEVIIVFGACSLDIQASNVCASAHRKLT
jgi:hypothetical protein